MSRDAPTVVAEKLSKWYGRIIAVSELTVEVGSGVTGLLGPNGAGKTSLLRCMSGQLKASLGSIKVLGESPWRNPALAARLGVCPDHPWLLDESTPAALIKFSLTVRGYPPEEAEKGARDSLAAFDLEKVADQRVSSLSRGTRQRAKLALAFAHRPQVLLLDEPLNGIDPVARARTIEAIREAGADGRAVVVSSHVLHEVEAMTEQIILMHKGRLLAHGNVQEIRELMDEHPHRIAVECDRPRDLARALLSVPSVAGVDFPRSGVVELHTQAPDECYGAIPVKADEEGVKIRSLSSPDASLEALFKHLVREG